MFLDGRETEKHSSYGRSKSDHLVVPELVMEDEIVGEVLGHNEPDLRASLVVRIQHRFQWLHLRPRSELESVVEEDGTHEGQCLKLLQRDRPLEQLPVGVSRPELLHEGGGRNFVAESGSVQVVHEFAAAGGGGAGAIKICFFKKW